MDEANELPNQQKQTLPKQIISSLDQLENFGSWTNESVLNIYEMSVESQLFSTGVKTFCISQEKKLASNYISLLNRFLALDKKLINTIKEKLWEDCEYQFYAVDYGADDEGKTNYEFFNIHSKEDAYKHTVLESVNFDTDDNTIEILFYPEWEEEHGFKVKVIGSELVFDEIEDKDFLAIREQKQINKSVSKEDLMVSLGLDSTEIAMLPKEITENTRFYNGDLNNRHLNLLRNKVKHPFSMSGNLDLDSLESAKGITLPQSIGGYLDLGYLGYYEPLSDLVLPESIGLDLNLRYLKTAEALILPKYIGRSINLMSLESAKGLNFPEVLKGSLYLHELKTTDGLVLPKHISGSLNLSDLTSIKGLKLPDSIGEDLWLSSLSAEEKQALIEIYPQYKDKIS